MLKWWRYFFLFFYLERLGLFFLVFEKFKENEVEEVLIKF